METNLEIQKCWLISIIVDSVEESEKTETLTRAIAKTDCLLKQKYRKRFKKKIENWPDGSPENVQTVQIPFE